MPVPRGLCSQQSERRSRGFELLGDVGDGVLCKDSRIASKSTCSGGS